MKSKTSLCSALLALLTGCATAPVEHVYTLRPAESTSPAAQSDLSLTTVAVSITATGMDRPQWVVRDAHHEVQILEQQRWMQALGGEIRQSLIDQLQTQLNQMPMPASSAKLVVTASTSDLQVATARGPRLHLDVEIKRFDSWAVSQAHVNDEIFWQLHCTGSQPQGLSDRQGLRSYKRQAPENQSLSVYQRLAESHQHVLGEAAEEIAQAMQEMAPRCRAQAQ